MRSVVGPLVRRLLARHRLHDKRARRVRLAHGGGVDPEGRALAPLQTERRRGWSAICSASAQRIDRQTSPRRATRWFEPAPMNGSTAPMDASRRNNSSRACGTTFQARAEVCRTRLRFFSGNRCADLLGLPPAPAAAVMLETSVATELLPRLVEPLLQLFGGRLTKIAVDAQRRGEPARFRIPLGLFLSR